MERTIDRLIEGFERGAMNRRQLVQALAVVVTGAHAFRRTASARASTVVAAPSRPTFRTAALDHISYSVSDYGRSRDFYVDLMGWEVVDDDGERQATLQIGDVGQIIVRNARRPVNIPAQGNRPAQTSQIDHIAWRIDPFDTDAVREDLERRGLAPRRDQGGPEMDYDSYHILDPDGWDLQISR